MKKFEGPFGFGKIDRKLNLQKLCIYTHMSVL